MSTLSSSPIGGHSTAGGARRFSSIVMTAFAAFGGILFGYDTGIISGILAMDDWIKTFGQSDSNSATGYSLPTSRESLIVSILSAGTFLGALAGAPIADTLGRRKSILLSCIVFSLGVGLQTGAATLATFVIGRFCAGLGVGLISTLVPVYQSECAPKDSRGLLVSCYQWAIAAGQLVAAVVNNATKDRPNHSSWQIPISLQLVWGFILFFGMLWLPETPRWFVMQGSREDAATALSRLRSLSKDDYMVQEELEEIIAALKEEREMGESSYLDCFRSRQNKISLRTFTGIAIQGWQQLTGINFIAYYGVAFLTNVGAHNPFLLAIAANISGTAMTFFGMWIVDIVGRRPLLIWGAVVMCICEYLIAVLGIVYPKTDLGAQKGLIALVILYVGAFAATWGPVAWVITGEIFPLNVRAKGVSLSAASNWLWNWALAFATPYLVNSGPGNAGLSGKVFFIWGTTCAGCAVFAYFCIPETMGLSLEQIDLLYQNSTPRTSMRYRRVFIAEHNRPLPRGDVEGSLQEIELKDDGEKVMVSSVVAEVSSAL
ncbi:AmMst-1 [Cubamyces lactineus]|nr:AmMst-1 [Cubamyces lactineus]